MTQADHNLEHIPCRLQARCIVNAQTPLFAITMGHAGLGLAWRAAHSAFGIPAIIGELLMALAFTSFVLVTVLFVLRSIWCPRGVMDDYHHPVRMNFFPAISDGLLLLAAGAYPYSQSVATVLWGAGTLIHLFLSVSIMARWLRCNTEIDQANPAWFIPIVSHLLVPLAGVPLGYIMISWSFFAIGLTFWIPFFTIMLYRLIFHDPLPPRMAPMLFILIAPPAVGLIAYLKLNGGQVDILTHILAATAIFIALVIGRLTAMFLHIPFALSWWAYTFPSAALATALIKYQALVGGLVPAGLSIIAIIFATLIITIVTIRTLAAAVTGQLFAQE